MTYLELVNKVLTRMREVPAVTVADSTYTLLIGEFVKQATQEVEDATDWNALRTTIQITTAPGDFNYTLTGSGLNFNILNVLNDTTDYEYFLVPAPSSAWLTRALLLDNSTNSAPTYYGVNGLDSNGDAIVDLFSIPDAVYTINFNLKIITDFTADTVETPVHWLPIVLRATMLALDERGDDGGSSLEILQSQFSRALADAVAYDRNLNADESTWEVV